jgi:hypothetical protein
MHSRCLRPTHAIQEQRLAEVSEKLSHTQQQEREAHRNERTSLLQARRKAKHEIAVLMQTKEINENVCAPLCPCVLLCARVFSSVPVCSPLCPCVRGKG